MTYSDDEKRHIGQKILAKVEIELSSVQTGARDDRTNIAIYDLGKFVNDGCLTRDEVQDSIIRAAGANGLGSDRRNGGLAKIRRNVERVLDDAARKREVVDWGKFDWNPDDGATSNAQRNGASHNGTDFAERTLSLKPLSSVKPRVPKWVWEHDGAGRIQLGTLALFAGKPGAGKSTATRWFAARISRGELPGVWFGHPMRVAVYSPEEQDDAMIVPGLISAGADMDMIVKPEIRYGTTSSGLHVIADEAALTEQLVANEVRALFVDPVMSTMGGKMNSHRSNEVREHLEPYSRIADAIKGIVVGVAHLRKGETHDVLEAINGSSAFGEVPRAVFGFAPYEAGVHVVQQVKNSAGPTGLALEYRLPLADVSCEGGEIATLPRFEITGKSLVRIEDLGHAATEGPESFSVVRDWLRDYLLEHQPQPPAQVKKDARNSLDISDRTTERAAKRLGVQSISDSQPGKPNRRAWALPEYWSGGERA